MSSSTVAKPAFRLFASYLLCALSGAAAEFIPLPLTGGANTGFSDTAEGDRQGGWTDQGGNDLRILAPGPLTVSGVPFDILAETGGAGKTCVVLGGPKRPYLPTRAVLPVAGKSGACLYLLHAAAWCPPAQAQKMTGVLSVDYADGTSSEIHVRFGRDVGDWGKPESYKNAARVWTAYNANTQVSLFLSRFALKPQPLKSVRFEAKESAWMIVAATLGKEVRLVPIRPVLTLDKTYAAPSLDAPLTEMTNAPAPRNIILIIGDGMGPGALKLASLYQHKAEGRLVMEQLPVAALCTTHSENPDATDSAAAATAIACGTKTANGMLGMTSRTNRLVSFAEVARQSGRSVGIVTSDALTGATPSGFYAHVPRRGAAQEIADFAAASGYEILIGSAAAKVWFAPKDAGGQRTDARNVSNEMASAGYAVVENAEAFARAPQDRRVLGFMDKPTLEPETCLGRLMETSLARLARNGKGFFMMMECTITDYGGHGNNPELTVRGTLQVDWAVRRAVEFARERGDTLVLVTADHETGGLNCAMSRTDTSRLVIHYTTTSHTATPVPLFAFGPGAQLFSGVIDNTDIAKTVAHLWRLALPPPAAPANPSRSAP